MSHTDQPNAAPDAQPIEELRAELCALETRAEQIGADLLGAREVENQAQGAFIEGHSDRAAMMEAGHAVSALENVAHTVANRIVAKRAEVEAAHATELRALRIEEARAHASRFLFLRGEVEADAHEIMALLESRGAQIAARIDAAQEAARDFRLCHQAIENPPKFFEASDGQSISAAKIDSDGAAHSLAWIYRNSTENHAARQAFEALYKGALRERETKWLQSFQDRSNATALNPDSEQMTRNIAATRAPAQPLNESQQREADARQWRLNAHQDTPDNGGRARMEGAPGDTMMDAINAEAQAARIASESRARAELEGVLA